LCSAHAQALAQSVTIGGFQFESNAVADTVSIVAGSEPTFYRCGKTGDDGAPTLPGLTAAESATRVVTDGIADAEIFGRSVLDVAFVDNVAVNEDGPDLAVFESGRPESFTVAVFDPLTRSFTPPILFTPAPTGFLGGCGFQLNAAQVDLTDFGVEPGTSRALVRIDNLGAPGCCDGADLMDVAAFHSGAPASEPLGLPGATFEANAGADAATVVPGSGPTFFQCGLTPEAGEPTLPGLTPDASATLVVSDGSADDEVFGKAVLDVGFTDNAPFNLRSRGLLPVALLSTMDVDALAVDPTTLTLGDPESTGTAAPVSSRIVDVNGDGRRDRLLFFSVAELVDAAALTRETTRLVLAGKTFTGLSVVGSTAVLIVAPSQDPADWRRSSPRRSGRTA